MQKIAVFGSAFNPPTLGHKSVIDSLGHFDRILLVPSISHAWGKDMLDYQTRCQLLHAFIRDLQWDKLELSNIESSLVQPQESVTTYAVLDALQTQHPDAQLTFVIGPDNLFNFGKFYRAQEILERWSVMACPQRLAIRSTDIRDKLSQHQSIAGLTTPSVEAMLVQQKLY
ncbi:nicotinate-nicotinamide nucleotide adenylyltransferase [Vibrio porteresiae]|uniref:nicotinate-nucleotide adenylyltransferase n=1 Tax=Vibrio porteresiae DSM 19223 TaxID=1123496 RepID=A0ABZ0QG58_9VIBR|nr:nicotinate-nicotinamide nucleotide adenylyltransferase [Vibrio porteresiae]WPC75463.1 nicotinate-nicotinamide nucleotide adenylyltransferase [Vibrio porteresiae DSM 19223]